MDPDATFTFPVFLQIELNIEKQKIMKLLQYKRIGYRIYRNNQNNFLRKDISRTEETIFSQKGSYSTYSPRRKNPPHLFIKECTTKLTTTLKTQSATLLFYSRLI